MSDLEVAMRAELAGHPMTAHVAASDPAVQGLTLSAFDRKLRPDWLHDMVLWAADELRLASASAGGGGGTLSVEATVKVLQSAIRGEAKKRANGSGDARPRRGRTVVQPDADAWNDGGGIRELQDEAPALAAEPPREPLGARTVAPATPTAPSDPRPSSSTARAILEAPATPADGADDAPAIEAAQAAARAALEAWSQANGLEITPRAPDRTGSESDPPHQNIEQRRSSRALRSVGPPPSRASNGSVPMKRAVGAEIFGEEDIPF